MLTKEQKTLVEENIGLIPFTMTKNGIASDYDEWYGVLAEGLCLAALNYDATVSQFSTFAIHCMENKIRHERRKTFASKRRGITISLDEPIHLEDSHKELTLQDIIGTSLAVDEQFISFNFNNYLTETEFFVIDLLMKGFGQEYIAGKLNMSQANVSRLIKKIRKKIRKEESVIR